MRAAERKRNPFVGSASGGRALSALMLPLLRLQWAVQESNLQPWA
jgi:hypothetical protein